MTKVQIVRVVDERRDLDGIFGDEESDRSALLKIYSRINF